MVFVPAIFLIKKMIVNNIFGIVAYSLNVIAKRLHLTYNEINIIVYYLLIPLSWAVMIDHLIGMPILTGTVVCIWLGIFIATRHIFRMWCDWMFEDSVKFLRWFSHIGWNYITASVIICVVIPVGVYITLICLML